MLQRKKHSTSFVTAFCAIEASLAVTLMLCIGIITIGTYALSALAGIILVPVVIEIGLKYAMVTYIIASLLSVILVPDKEAVLCFIFFLGYYPLIKAKIEQIKSKLLQWIIKLAAFNIAMILVFKISVAFLSVDPSEYELFGVYLPGIFLAIGNLIFVLYDFGLTLNITRYVLVWREKLRFLFK